MDPDQRREASRHPVSGGLVVLACAKGSEVTKSSSWDRPAALRWCVAVKRYSHWAANGLHS